MPTRDGIDLADLPFRAFLPLFLALLALVCAPLALSVLPPLLDYPNHLARMYLLANLDHAPVLRQFYQLAWRPLPDLAMDALVPPLLHVMPLEWAGKLFLVATYALLTSGVAVLHRVLFGRWSAWPCLAFLLIYNRLLLWGFLNFLFGLGLALWAFAAWAAWRERGVAWRLGCGLVLALAVYFAHLMAFGVYGALVLSYEAAMLRREHASPLAAARALLVAFLPLLPPLALFAMIFIPLHGSAGMAAFGIQFARPVRKLDLLFNVFDAYSRPADIACFAAALLGMGLAYWRHWVRLAPGIGVVLIVLAALYLLMPSTLFGATSADHRLPLVMALLLIGGSTWQAPSRSLQRVFFGAALAMLVLRLGMVATSWQASGRVYAEILPGLDLLPEGGCLAVAYPGEDIHAEATPLVHLPVLAIARREAFVPSLFTYASQQPVAFTPDYRQLADSLSADRLWSHFVTGDGPLDGSDAQALAKCGTIAFSDRRPFDLSVKAGLDPVFVSPRFQIYRLVPAGAKP